jgi:hypothetical protein
MTNETPKPERKDAVLAGRRPATGAPLWVKALVIAFVALIIFIVVLHLTGNSFGGHGM